MKSGESSNVSSALQYDIDGYHIVDKRHAQPIYIRELLDSASSEFLNSKLTSHQKLEMIEAIGIEHLTEVLADCFACNHKGYDAKKEAQWTYQMLMMEVRR